MPPQTSGSFHLTKKTDYGLLLLAILAKYDHKECKSVSEIAKENHIPTAFLQKIANTLQKHKLISTERGKYGGSYLAKPAKKITIKEVVEALEGPIALTPCACPKIKTSCSCSQYCKIKNGITQLNKEIEKYFLSKTLDNFID